MRKEYIFLLLLLASVLAPLASAAPCNTNTGSPYYPNGTWAGWLNSCPLVHAKNNSTDAVTATVGTTFHVLPIIPLFFLGALYVFLWVKFAEAPARFKIAAIASLVLVISIFFAAAGFTADAVFNFIVFGLAFLLSYLFKG